MQAMRGKQPACGSKGSRAVPVARCCLAGQVPEEADALAADHLLPRQHQPATVELTQQHRHAVAAAPPPPPVAAQGAGCGEARVGAREAMEVRVRRCVRCHGGPY